MEGFSRKGFTRKDKAGEAKENRLLIYFYLGLQNNLTSQYLSLRKIGETKVGKSSPKRTLICYVVLVEVHVNCPPLSISLSF